MCAKDLENAKKREEKYKGDLEAMKVQFEDLQKEHKKLKKEGETQGPKPYTLRPTA